jgi:hypothetical protein
VRKKERSVENVRVEKKRVSGLEALLFHCTKKKKLTAQRGARAPADTSLSSATATPIKKKRRKVLWPFGKQFVILYQNVIINFK